jgi:aspartate aminotransferase
MPKISQRGHDMPPSPIRKLVPYADGAKARGVHVYHLNIGQPDLPTPAQFMETVRNAQVDTIEYSPSGGFPSLIEKFAQYYRKLGLPVQKENLIVTTGGSEALLFAFMSCLDPGDEVIVPEPFYANYNGFAIASGTKVTPINTRIEDNFDLPEIEEFEKLITARTKAILICNPSNPTGKLYDQAALEKLRDVVKKHDLFLFVDEVYREFVYDGQVHYSALKLEGVDQNVVIVDSISKRYAACGARIGMVVSHNKEVMAAAMKFAQARLSPPTLEQIGAEGLTDLPQSYFDDVNAEYVSRRDTMVRELRKIPGVLVPEVSGAFYMVVRLPVDDTEKFCQWILESFQYNGATVMLAPASGFYSTPGLGRDEVRIAYVLEKPELVLACECLHQALKAYAGSNFAAAASQANL